MEIESGGTVRDLLASEDIEPQEVLVSRGGKVITVGHDLGEGDVIEIRDVIAGG